MSDTSHRPNDRGIALGHEPTDADPRWLLLFAGGLFATLVLTSAFVWWLLATYAKQAELAEAPSSPFAQERHDFPEPRLEVASSQQLRELRAREDELLNSAAWIDRNRNLARIPIERAIEIVANEGLPRWPATPTERPIENTEEQP